MLLILLLTILPVHADSISALLDQGRLDRCLPRPENGTALKAATWMRPFRGLVAVNRGEQAIVREQRRSSNSSLLSWEFHEPVPVGAMTQTLVAMTALKLVDDGRLRLGDRLGKFFPETPAPLAAITIEELVEHRSGLAPSMGGLGTVGVDAANVCGMTAPNALGMAGGERARVFARLKVGPKKMALNELNYVLLARVLETVTGRPYARLLREKILLPLGMNATFVATRPEDLARIRPGLRLRSCGLEEEPDFSFAPQCAFAAGDVISTADDLLRLSRLFRRGYVFSADMLETLRARVKAAKSLGDESARVLGWDVIRQGGHTWIGHGGHIQGFNTRYEFEPESETTLVVIDAQDDYWEQSFPRLVRQLRALALVP